MLKTLEKLVQAAGAAVLAGAIAISAASCGKSEQEAQQGTQVSSIDIPNDNVLKRAKELIKADKSDAALSILQSYHSDKSENIAAKHVLMADALYHQIKTSSEEKEIVELHRKIKSALNAAETLDKKYRGARWNFYLILDGEHAESVKTDSPANTLRTLVNGLRKDDERLIEKAFPEYNKIDGEEIRRRDLSKLEEELKRLEEGGVRRLAAELTYRDYIIFLGEELAGKHHLDIAFFARLVYEEKIQVLQQAIDFAKNNGEFYSQVRFIPPLLGIRKQENVLFFVNKTDPSKTAIIIVNEERGEVSVRELNKEGLIKQKDGEWITVIGYPAGGKYERVWYRSERKPVSKPSLVLETGKYMLEVAEALEKHIRDNLFAPEDGIDNLVKALTTQRQDGRGPVDAWGRPLVFTRSENKKEGTLYSLGPDGEDQNGQYDDIRIRVRDTRNRVEKEADLFEKHQPDGKRKR